MSNLSRDDIASAKARGFLLNRDTDCFSGRVVVPAGLCSAAQLRRIADCAERFGNGESAFTSRLNAEIIGIPFDRLDEASAFISGGESGLRFGGTGARIRPITACKGTTCVFGNCDTRAFARELHEKYYLGKANETLPGKFKICVGGCPNSCMKPSINDFGIEARRGRDTELFQIYVGGMWGRHTRAGTPLAALVSKEDVFLILDAVLTWYADNAQPRERLGAAIDRLGFDSLEKALQLGG